MGASGAGKNLEKKNFTQSICIIIFLNQGKTTLLNALNLRNRGALKVDGEIRVNGKLVTSLEDISSISGYVQQDDLFIGYLTVKEHLLFQAMLRMSKKTNKKERMARVYEVMREVFLINFWILRGMPPLNSITLRLF
jgi:ABC-type branched-subunit amino acid transport system ATPase component